MPTAVEELQQVAKDLARIDTNDILRPSLGELSLAESFTNQLGNIKQEIAFVVKYASDVHTDQVKEILYPFQQIRRLISDQAEHTNEVYVTQSPQFLQDVGYQIEEVKRYSVPFVTSAIKSRGVLDDEGIRRGYENTIRGIRKEAERSLSQVKAEAQRTIDEAKDLADKIEKRARQTAARISVEEAQKQFKEAQVALNRRVWFWSGVSVVFGAGFFITAVYFMNTKLAQEWKWYILYQSAIRITILTAVGTATAFCLKILRAHLHMSEKNRHRQHVANSIGAFVESAVTPEQRDQILSQLVESVVQFGTSGLLHHEEENLYKPKMTIDTIARNVSTPAIKQ